MVPTDLSRTTTVSPVPPVEAVVIGASAGAIDALRALLPALPSTFACPVVVVVHVPPDRPSLITEIFAPQCALAVREPVDKEPLGPGIWFAPPGYHLLIEDDRTFSLSVDEPVCFSRPSIDVLFESAADAFADKLLAIVLTGASDDGARGARAIRRAGGYVAVQRPDEALVPTMPEAAIAAASPQRVASLGEICAMLRDVTKVGDA